MIVKLKTAASLMKYLPNDGNGSEIELEVAEKTTPLQVLESLNIPFQKQLLVVVNKVKLHREEVGSIILKEGETMAIYTALSGG